MNPLSDGASVFIHNWKLITGILVLAFIIVLPFAPRLKANHQPASTSTGIFLALFIIASLFLRLAFVSKALLPSYFDSAQHYALIKNVMVNDISHIFDTLRENYYHMGFHFVAAFFSSIFQTEITKTMLILGQVMLAVLPFPFFFIVRSITRSNWAGMFAVILSAFGWYMPSHAVDWGKYPALMSLVMILFVLCQAFVSEREKGVLHTQKRMYIYVLLGVSVLLSAAVHSRSIIVLGIVAIAWTMSVWWHQLPRLQKQLFVSLLIVIVITESIFVRQHDVLLLLFDPYINKGILTTLLVIFLSIFAYNSYPQLTFINIFTICLLLGSLFIPVADIIPGHTQLTLMDRPYVEMILFVPLSLLGGLGVAGLEKWIKRSYQKYVALIGIVLLLIYAIFNHEFYPSDCCVIVGNDDVAAMAWMENQLPVDARIEIASTGLKVVAADVIEGYVGADAGIWVTPLIERQTVLIPYDSEFDQQEILDSLCVKRIGYLFIGELGQTFDIAKLDLRPAWYRPLLSMPRTRVYEVIGCNL